MRTAILPAAAAALALACPALAGLNKCVDADGNVTYRQTACPGSAGGSATAIEVDTGAPPQAGDDHWSVANQVQRMEAQQQADSERRAREQLERARNRQDKIPRPSSLAIRNAIVSREVLRGMTPDEVEDALGPPDSTYRGSGGYSSWSYRGYDSNGNYRSLTVQFQSGQMTGTTSYQDAAPTRFNTDKGRWLE